MAKNVQHLIASEHKQRALARTLTSDNANAETAPFTCTSHLDGGGKQIPQAPLYVERVLQTFTLHSTLYDEQISELQDMQLK